MPDEERERIRAKWERWLVEVQPDVLRMGHDREIRCQFISAVVEADPGAPGTFVGHYLGLYRDAQALTIRRLMLSRNTDRRSLAALIKNLVVHPALLERERYVELVEGPTDGHDEAWRAATARHFDQVYGDVAGVLDRAKLDADLARITDTCSVVTAFVDESLAHVGEATVVPTWDELDRCIDLAEEMFVKYSELITGQGWVLPPIVDPLWKRTFTKPIFRAPGADRGPSTR